MTTVGIPDQALAVQPGGGREAPAAARREQGEMDSELRLFFAPNSLRLLGGWVVGIDAANLIGEIGTAVAAGLTAHQLARFPDPHPMASEGIGKAARRLV